MTNYILQLWGGTMKRLLRVLTIATFVAIPNVAFAQEAGLVLEELLLQRPRKKKTFRILHKPSMRYLAVHWIIIKLEISAN